MKKISKPISLLLIGVPIINKLYGLYIQNKEYRIMVTKDEDKIRCDSTTGEFALVINYEQLFQYFDISEITDLGKIKI